MLLPRTLRYRPAVLANTFCIRYSPIRSQSPVYLKMHSKARAAAEETPPGPGADLVEDFRKIGITENHLHLFASRGPSGGTKDEPLVSPAAVCEAALKRRERGESVTGDAAPRCECCVLFRGGGGLCRGLGAHLGWACCQRGRGWIDRMSLKG